MKITNCLNRPLCLSTADGGTLRLLPYEGKTISKKAVTEEMQNKSSMGWITLEESSTNTSTATSKSSAGAKEN